VTPGAPPGVPLTSAQEHLLVLSCPDRPGIVHAVSTFLVVTGCNILDSQQYRDPDHDRFFLRVHFAASARAEDPATTAAQLQAAFGATATSFGMDWHLDAVRPMPTLLMVSRQDHCLQDLLFRHRTGALPVELTGVVSNHDDTRALVEWHGVPFHHVPVTPEAKPQAEARLLELVEQTGTELVVLARYMQVLSADLCRTLAGRAINIHTRSCRASRVHGRMPRRTSAASSSSAPVPTTSRPTSTRARSSSRTSRGPTTPTRSSSWPASARTSRPACSPAPCCGTPNGGCCSTGTAPSSSASGRLEWNRLNPDGCCTGQTTCTERRRAWMPTA
jgi:formyltetrahydrofolate hydrolase